MPLFLFQEERMIYILLIVAFTIGICIGLKGW